MTKWLALIFCLFFSLPALAHDPTVTVWLGDGSLLGATDLKADLERLSQNQPNPQHIAVLVHGYNTSRESSFAQFQEIGKRFQAQYALRNQKVLVIGLQWESAPPGNAVPWKAERLYLSMVERARLVGHNAARQVLLSAAQQFPDADISIYGHSLGCEVIVASLIPEMLYPDKLVKSTAYLPDKDLSFQLVGLVGSDLDYDLWHKSGVLFRKQNPRARMLYMTVSPYLGKRDKTLQIRQMSRGLAGGSAFPRMTLEQCDAVYKNRAILYDNRNIPTNHSFTDYYQDVRVQQLVQIANFLVNPKAPKPPQLEEADKILRLPNTLEALVPYLDSPNISSQLYALWRIEQINCGSSLHLCDETLGKLASMLRNRPAQILKESRRSQCKTVKRRIWPTAKTMTRAGVPDW